MWSRSWCRLIRVSLGPPGRMQVVVIIFSHFPVPGYLKVIKVDTWDLQCLWVDWTTMVLWQFIPWFVIKLYMNSVLNNEGQHSNFPKIKQKLIIILFYCKRIKVKFLHTTEPCNSNTGANIKITILWFDTAIRDENW